MRIDWTIVGVVVGVIGLVIAYLQLVRTPQKKQKGEPHLKNKLVLGDTSIKGDTINTIQGDHVNVNQTIINNIKEAIPEPKAEKSESTIHIPEFERAKKKIERHKSRLRSYIYAVFASAKANELDSRLEVRHVQDVLEEIISVGDSVTLEELKLMQEEGVIEFSFKENEYSIGPYTRIKLKAKFYAEIL